MRRPANPLRLRQARRHRLFDENVLAVVERSDRELGMARMRRRDDHRVYMRIFKHRFEVVVRLSAVLADDLLACRPRSAESTPELEVGQRSNPGKIADARDIAAADDGNSD